MATISYPTVKFYNPDLLLNVPRTFLTTELTTVGSSLGVQSIVGFGDGDYILVGEFGQEKAEIVRISGSPSGSTITLTASTSFTHERGTSIYRIDRNRVEFSRATTLTGSKPVLSTDSIRADSLYTVYEDLTNTTGFGFARANNQADATFSNYSESYPYAGYGSQTLKVIFDSVLASLGLKGEDGQPAFKDGVTREDAFQAVVDCQESLAIIKRRWSYLTDFNIVIAELATGQDTYALPSNVAVENGRPAILQVRIGSQDKMIYIDKEQLNRRRVNIVKTGLTTSVTTVSATWTLDDTSDLDDSGTFVIINDDGEATDSITYTANNRTTNALTVTITSIAESHTAGAIIWQGASFDKPLYWTVFEGNIVLDLPPSATWEQYNLLADLYTSPTVVNDLADEAQFPATVIKPYVASKLAEILDHGPSTRSKEFFGFYTSTKGDLIGSERTGQFVRLKPMRVPDMTANQRMSISVSESDTNS